MKSADSLQEVRLISALALGFTFAFPSRIPSAWDRTSHPRRNISTAWSLSHHPNMHGVEGTRETGRSGESKLRLTYLKE